MRGGTANGWDVWDLASPLVFVLYLASGWISGRGPGEARAFLVAAALILLAWAFPLVRPLSASGPAGRLLERLRPLQPLAGAFLAVALLLPRGGMAATAASAVWAAYLLALAACGALRFLGRGADRWDPAELCIDAALLWLVSGAGGLVAWCAAVDGLPFSDTIVFLTAVHFHAIPAAVLVPAGRLGRALDGRGPLYAGVAALLIGAPGVIAAGFTFSVALQTAGVVLLATGVLGAAWIAWRRGLDRMPPGAPRRLLWVWIAAAPAGMLLALAWQCGLATGAWTMSIAFMIRTHGTAQLLGLGLGGILAFRIAAARRHETETP